MPARRLRQYYLGPSPENTLCVTFRPPSPPPESLGKCYISMLPDELLDKIFAYLPPPEIELDRPSYADRPPIAIICKHWEYVYDATLYRTISFSDLLGGMKSPALMLVKAIRERTELRKHVRNILVERIRIGETICRMIVGTINCCQTVRLVSLYLDWTPKVWPIVQAVGVLPRLEILDLSGYRDGPNLQMVLDHFNCRALKKLTLSRYGIGQDDRPDAPRHPIHPPLSKDAMERFSILAHSRSSLITTLELNDPSASPHCSRILLNWPARLVRLSLSQLAGSTYWSDYTSGAVERILDIHRDSLQLIEVGVIPGRRDQRETRFANSIPDFSRFPCLHEVYLSAYNILAEKPSKAAAKVSAPVLRHLGLRFCTEDQVRESFRDFSQDQVQWMADFASEKSNPNNKLQSVFIDFHPVIDILREDEAPIWPWDYLQQAEKEMSQYHIEMKWSEPDFTQDEWDQRLRKLHTELEAARSSFNVRSLEMLVIGEAREQD